MNWSRAFYDLAYRFSKPRWDTNVPPPELVELVESGEAGRRALDLGCGTGANAIYLAQHGFTTVGVDFSPRAIKLAGQKAERAAVTVAFQLGDVSRLGFLREPFDLVLDIGCFHGLDTQSRVRYAQHLARLTHKESKFLLWAFDRAAYFGTFGVTPEEVQQTFNHQFKLTRVQHGVHRGVRGATWYWFSRL